jgi:hypothetical protein
MYPYEHGTVEGWEIVGCLCYGCKLAGGAIQESHGIGAYRRGCRCEVCRDASRRHKARHRARLRERSGG